MATKHRILCTLLPCLALPLVAQDKEEVRPRDLEGMYARAAFILDDRSISNVYGVTAMLEKCAHWGHPLAIELLLDVYEGRRKGLDPLPEKAATLADAVATDKLKLDPRHPEAARVRRECMFRYALYCERGFGCPESEKAALHHMLQAANEGPGKARVELARYLMDRKKTWYAPRKALQLLRNQAKADPTTPKVFFYLGHIYMTGLGLPRPMPQLALESYRLGEKMKDPCAINNLAAMHERGIATARDLTTALHLYRKAAELGNKEASANLQRLAYIKAELATGTPPATRIDNAALQVIEALPLSPRTRNWLAVPFRKQENATR